MPRTVPQQICFSRGLLLLVPMVVYSAASGTFSIILVYSTSSGIFSIIWHIQCTLCLVSLCLVSLCLVSLCLVFLFAIGTNARVARSRSWRSNHPCTPPLICTYASSPVHTPSDMDTR